MSRPTTANWGRLLAVLAAGAACEFSGGSMIEPYDGTEAGTSAATDSTGSGTATATTATSGADETAAEGSPTAGSTTSDDCATGGCESSSSGGTSAPSTTAAGGCGETCGPGGHCLDDACTCFGGVALCDGACVDTQRDPDHCGGCGGACGGDVCRGGECEDDCDGATPNACGGWCTDVTVDVFNCGECGLACAVGEACVAGECTGFSVTACTECPCPDCEDQCCAGGYFGGLVACVEGGACPV